MPNFTLCYSSGEREKELIRKIIVAIALAQGYDPRRTIFSISELLKFFRKFNCSVCANGDLATTDETTELSLTKLFFQFKAAFESLSTIKTIEIFIDANKQQTLMACYQQELENGKQVIVRRRYNLTFEYNYKLLTDYLIEKVTSSHSLYSLLRSQLLSSPVPPPTPTSDISAVELPSITSHVISRSRSARI
ncbi:MAG: hypothetical protein KBD64_07190 [Gammaproteobacteria bacterium]|nr:hypothetical protein [Gammaproteobacteria bacterium]